MQKDTDLAFPFGQILKVDIDSSQCSMKTSFGIIVAYIKKAQAVVQVPKRGEFWTYRTENSMRFVNERIQSAPKSSDLEYGEGDVVIQPSGNLHVKAKSISVTDDEGIVFDSVSGTMSTNAMPSSSIFIVNRQDDVRSIDGKIITYPCILAVISTKSFIIKMNDNDKVDM